MQLADSGNLIRFTKLLEKAERTVSFGAANESESKFVAEMRDRFETREQALDLGCQPWNPTMKQYNWLHTIANTGNH